MSESTEIHDRVSRLEQQMTEVRYLATKADREASGNTAVLRGQVGILNAISETQREHGQTLAKHTKILADHSRTLADHGRTLGEHTKMLDQIDHKADTRFAEMRRGFAVLGAGQQKITELLTGRSDDQDRSG